MTTTQIYDSGAGRVGERNSGRAGFGNSQFELSMRFILPVNARATEKLPYFSGANFIRLSIRPI